jgi:MFS transporter, DHA1 family, inner membrane transport protein
VSGLLLLFGVSAMVGNSLGGYGADNIGYGRLMASILSILALSLVAFSLLAAVSGTTLAVLGTSATLVAWGVAGFAINPLQQYRVIKLAPCTQNVALSLNASAIYLGQGIGAAIGALVLDYTSLAALGGAGALCTLAALAILFLGTRRPALEAAPET